MGNLVFQNPHQAGALFFDNPHSLGPGGANEIPLSTDLITWLRNSTGIRLVLVKAMALINGVETPVYMSNHGWKSGPNDNPPNTHYAPIIKSGVQFSEQLQVKASSSLSLSMGDIEIDNVDGVRENWLDYIFTNRTIEAWIGDERWAFASFHRIFNGVMAPIARKSTTKLALKLRDKSKLLDAAMTEHKLGGLTANADSIIPICLGECHNITPLLINPALLQYQVNDGPIEGFIEVRVNGVQVAYIGDPATGTFVLLREPSGTVTCDVWGDKFGGVYRNTVGSLIRRVVTGYGKEMDRFTNADLDLVNLDQFEIDNPQAVGIYISDRTNVLVACQMLASSVGAQMSMSRLGLLRLIKIALPANGTVRKVYQHEFVADSLTPVGTIDPVAAIKLNFCRNWSPQKGIVSDIPAEAISLFESDVLTVSAVNETVRDQHKLSTEVIATDTYLVDQAEAQAMADAELEMWQEVHIPYEGEGFPELLELQIGQPVLIYYDDFSMSAGVPGIVMRLTPDWDNCHVRVGFLV